MRDKLSPEKKIAIFREIEDEKKKELEALKKKQEEREQELEDARSQLERSVQELEIESEDLFETAEEELHKNDEEQDEVASIDELAIQTSDHDVRDHISYDGLDKLKAENLYELTDYNTYNELKRLEEKAYLSKEEQDMLQSFQDQLTTIQDSYSQNHINNLDELRGGYISRTEKVLKKIHDKMHDLNQSSDYSQGEYRW